jgi:hypothetical protein
MTVTDITRESNLVERLQPLAAYDNRPRTDSRLHITQIYRSIEDTLRSKEISTFSPEELKFYACGGFMWERVFSMAMAEGIRGGDIVRPGEFSHHGIIGSPDNYHIPLGEVVETKMTWRSSRKLEHLEKNFFAWLVQIKGYCKLLGTTRSQLHTFFVNGKYAPPVPEAVSLRLTWNAVEIEENWEMLERHAREKRWM